MPTYEQSLRTSQKYPAVRHNKRWFSSPDTFASIDLYGASARGKEESDDIRHCFHLENESSGGDITLYRVFPYSIFPNTSPSPAWIKRSARLSIGVVDLLISTSLCPL